MFQNILSIDEQQPLSRDLCVLSRHRQW